MSEQTKLNLSNLPLSHEELLGLIKNAFNDGRTELYLNDYGITELPEEIGTLRNLKTLSLAENKLTRLPDSIGNLVDLEELVLEENQITELPESIGNLTKLQVLRLGVSQYAHDQDNLEKLAPGKGNLLKNLPSSFSRLKGLRVLDLSCNQFSTFPKEICKITYLRTFQMSYNSLKDIPEEIASLKRAVRMNFNGNMINELPTTMIALDKLRHLIIGGNFLTQNTISKVICKLKLTHLFIWGNKLQDFPIDVLQLRNLEVLSLVENEIRTIPTEIETLIKLDTLFLNSNKIVDLPASLGRMENLRTIELEDNPLTPTLKSVLEQGMVEFKAFLRSLEDAVPLYEAKIILVGEGNVGKTTLLKALSGREPRKGEPTTHGVSIDIHSMFLSHPNLPAARIQFNAWDFGGQEVYRVTHQFFFSQRAIYLLVWQPRMGVQEGQVEEWLKLIRLRVGNNARVIIVSTHAKTGQHIARIDKPVILQEYGTMIIDFVEVDSLVDDPASEDKYGIARLRQVIAEAAITLEHMGMPFNINWRAARDAALELGATEPHVSYREFSNICEQWNLDEVDTRTLSILMHDLGYIVYYGDDERLKDDVILQPEWLTKAIGFVLEDPITLSRDGILPDNHLREVWLNHSFANEPRYKEGLYPFFLRLMEKYDVSYRLESGQASLVAQHVPQVRPPLPWLPEEDPLPERRRLSMVCVLEDSPPGLVPWMIVRTHDYACEMEGHQAHWQKGMFLRKNKHGEALLELRGREFHMYTEALWPQYFMNILHQTLKKLIDDNWPGMQGRYRFTVPCQWKEKGIGCQGRFDIDALVQFLEEGDSTIRCQVCRTRQEIVDLLFGFEDEEPRKQLANIERKIDRGFENLQQEIVGFESRLANYVMAIMRAIADEAKNGPRLFDLQPKQSKNPFARKQQLRLWCEAEGCQHPVLEEGLGVYNIEVSREWVKRVAPYAQFVGGLLKTLLPVITPSVNVLFGTDTIENLGISDHLDLMQSLVDQLPDEIKVLDPSQLHSGLLKDDERSGLLALHSLLGEIDPHHANLGLHRVATYTGDYLWLCNTHYALSQSKIPDKIQ